MADSIRMLVCAMHGADVESLHAYARHFNDLLEGQIDECQPEDLRTRRGLERTTCGYDLLLLAPKPLSGREILLGGHPCCRAAERCPVSTIVVRGARWPLNSVLVVLRVEAIDNVAVDWLCRLARPDQTRVSILPIVPSPPLMFGPDIPAHNGLGRLLASDTDAGQRLRQQTEQLRQAHLGGQIHMRLGEPAWQIREELAAEEYDLIIIGGEPQDRLHRWMAAELVGPLLRTASRPVLVARKKLPMAMSRHA